MITHPHRSLLGAALLGVSALVACQSSGNKKVDATSNRMEDLRVSIETLKQQMTGTVEALAKVVETGAVDPKPAMESFGSQLSASSKTAVSSRKQLNGIKEDAQKLFDQWTKNAEGIADTDIREASTKRRDDLSKALDSVVSTTEPALDSVDAFLAKAKDVHTYLKQDLTPGGIEAISSKSKSISKSVGDVGKQLDKALEELNDAAPKFATAKAAVPAKS